MGPKDETSAKPADIGDALVAALGFEPADGKKLGRGTVAEVSDVSDVSDQLSEAGFSVGDVLEEAGAAGLKESDNGSTKVDDSDADSDSDASASDGVDATTDGDISEIDALLEEMVGGDAGADADSSSDDEVSGDEPLNGAKADSDLLDDDIDIDADAEADVDVDVAEASADGDDESSPAGKRKNKSKKKKSGNGSVAASAVSDADAGADGKGGSAADDDSTSSNGKASKAAVGTAAAATAAVTAAKMAAESSASVVGAKAAEATSLVGADIDDEAPAKLTDAGAVFDELVRGDLGGTAVAGAEVAGVDALAETVEARKVGEPGVSPDSPAITGEHDKIEVEVEVEAEVAPTSQPAVVDRTIVDSRSVVDKPKSISDMFSGGITGRRRLQARKVRRVIRHVDPWSVLTFSVLFHLCLFAALLLASVLVWNVAEEAGTIENLESFIRELGDYESFEIDGEAIFRAAVAIAGIMTLAASVLVVLLTVVFNLLSDLLGGVRVTVIEEETIRVKPKKTDD